MTQLLSLAAHEVDKSFGDVHAVNKLSLEVPPSQILALLGANGAGKSTFIDIALGLQTADSGDITLLGMSPQEAIKRSLIGVIQQDGGLFGDFTVMENLKLFSSVHSHTLPIDQILEETHLTDKAKQKVRKLSGGEQSRVRLAMALINDPLMLFLDEPTGNMDVANRRKFWESMRVQAQRGRTIIFATHYLQEAQDFAERIVIMAKGRSIIDGSVNQLIHTYAASILRITIPSSIQEEAQRALDTLPDRKNYLVEWLGNEVQIEGTNLDDAARVLLAFPQAHDLTLTPSSLEDAFTTITEEA